MPFEPWNDRQKDFAHYFNPAYLGVLTWGLVKGYNSEGGGMPLSLVFPAVPLLLHPASRDNMPRTVRARFSNWLRENPSVRAELPIATQMLVPRMKEGLLISMGSSWISAEEQNLFAASRGPTAVKTADAFKSDIKRAEFLGKWFVRCGDEREIYQQMGIQP